VLQGWGLQGSLLLLLLLLLLEAQHLRPLEQHCGCLPPLLALLNRQGTRV
jgi:hypothetical protein